MEQREKLVEQLTKWQKEQRDLEQQLARAPQLEKAQLTDKLMTIEVHIGRLEDVLGLGGDR